jgi:hypothetical protein
MVFNIWYVLYIQGGNVLIYWQGMKNGLTINMTAEGNFKLVVQC